MNNNDNNDNSNLHKKKKCTNIYQVYVILKVILCLMDFSCEKHKYFVVVSTALKKIINMIMFVITLCYLLVSSGTDFI